MSEEKNFEAEKIPSLEVVSKDTTEPDVEPMTASDESVMKLDLPTAINTVIARTEATSIVVTIINCLLDILQSRDPATFSQEEVNKLQNVVNTETSKTDELFREIEKILERSKKGSGRPDTKVGE